MRKIYAANQIQIDFDSAPSITTATEVPTPLEPVVLPSTNITLIEQFALGLQARDMDLLNNVITNSVRFPWLNTSKPFVQVYLDYCNVLEARHGKIYIQTVNGCCQRERCNIGQGGLAVTVFTVSQNTLLWSFNLVAKEFKDGKLGLWRCKAFGVNVEDV